MLLDMRMPGNVCCGYAAVNEAGLVIGEYHLRWAGPCAYTLPSTSIMQHFYNELGPSHVDFCFSCIRDLMVAHLAMKIDNTVGWKCASYALPVVDATNGWKDLTFDRRDIV
jgi:hypothetical protein